MKYGVYHGFALAGNPSINSSGDAHISIGWRLVMVAVVQLLHYLTLPRVTTYDELPIHRNSTLYAKTYQQEPRYDVNKPETVLQYLSRSKVRPQDPNSETTIIQQK